MQQIRQLVGLYSRGSRGERRDVVLGDKIAVLALGLYSIHHQVERRSLFESDRGLFVDKCVLVVLPSVDDDVDDLLASRYGNVDSFRFKLENGSDIDIHFGLDSLPCDALWGEL